MPDLNDPLIQLHLSVAKIEGMLSTVIASHAEKITAIETKAGIVETRLNEKSRRLATLEERSDNIEEDIVEMKNDNTGRAGRNLSVISLIIAGVTAILAVTNSFTGG